MIKLDVENVVLLHDIVLKQTGGLKGVRDINMLDCSLSNVYQTFDDQELYPTIEEKGARMCYALITNHPFVDGNKRIGILVMLSFFELNGVNLKYSDDDLIKIGVHVADGTMDYQTLLKWVVSSEISAGVETQEQNSASL